MDIRNIKISRNQAKYSFVYTVIFLAIVGIIFYFGNVNKLKLLVDHADTETYHVSNFFNTFESQDIKALSATLDGILQDPGFKKVFLKQDRDELNKYGQPLFQKLKAGYGITHFYFMLPDGITFLRLHNPDIHSDTNNRITFRKAVETKEIGEGIELGKTAFALRVVKPYYDGDKLIGYIELGQEIDHFLSVLKERNGHEYAIYVNKKNLNKSDWEASRKNINKENNWDDFSDMISTNSTIDLEGDIDERAKVCFSEEIGKMFFSNNFSDNSIINLDLKMACSGFLINDASGTSIGVVIFEHDLSDRIVSYGKFVNGISLIVIFLLIFVVISSVYISRKSQDAENKFKVLFDSSLDAIMTLNPTDGKYYDGNMAALKLFGLKDVNELKSTTPVDLSPERQPDGKLSSEKAKEMIDLAIKNNSNSFEWNHKKLHGPEFIARVSLNRIDGSNALQAIVRDITEEKTAFNNVMKSEAEAKKALDEAERMNKVMIGRELDMINLKKQLRDLKDDK